MPKTGKRSRSAANTGDTGNVENVLLRLLPTELRTASVNSFKPTAFHSYSICVHVLRFLVAILGCKKNLAAQSEVCCRFTAKCFLPFFCLKFDERKTQSFFSLSKTFIDFTRQQLLRVFCALNSCHVTSPYLTMRKQELSAAN